MSRATAIQSTAMVERRKHRQSPRKEKVELVRSHSSFHLRRLTSVPTGTSNTYARALESDGSSESDFGGAPKKKRKKMKPQHVFNEFDEGPRFSSRGSREGPNYGEQKMDFELSGSDDENSTPAAPFDLGQFPLSSLRHVTDEFSTAATGDSIEGVYSHKRDGEHGQSRSSPRCDSDIDEFRNSKRRTRRAEAKHAIPRQMAGL